MRKQKYDGHTRKGLLSFYNNAINKQIEKAKFNLAYEITLEAMDIFPGDYILIRFQTFLLVKLKRYEEALEILEPLVGSDAFTVHGFHVDLTLIYIYQNNKEKLLELYNKYFVNLDESNFYYNFFRLYKIYLMSFLDIPSDNLEFKSYHEIQLYNYKEDVAIEHIKDSHVNSGDNSFSSNIDVEDLFYRVKYFIDNNKDCYNQDHILADSYVIKYPNVHENDSSCNYIKVICISGTSNILTMFPSYAVKGMKVASLNDSDEFKCKKKIRSGLERFNGKYI